AVVTTSSLIFFVTSRRRHTRCYRDWSSDVCSSDLLNEPAEINLTVALERLREAAAAEGIHLDPNRTSSSDPQADIIDVVSALTRSEERRVGNEERSHRW